MAILNLIERSTKFHNWDGDERTRSARLQKSKILFPFIPHWIHNVILFFEGLSKEETSGDVEIGGNGKACSKFLHLNNEETFTILDEPCSKICFQCTC